MKPKKQNPLLLAAMTLAGITFTATQGHAASGTWTGAAASGIWGGTGNWTGGTVADGSGFTASFTGEFTATQNVVVNSARTIGNITFTDTTPTHDLNLNLHASNFVLTLAGTTPTINVTQAGRTVTINTITAGTVGLTKSGPGNLTLTNAGNTYTGNTLITGGVLNVSGAGKISGNTTANKLALQPTAAGNSAIANYTSSATSSLFAVVGANVGGTASVLNQSNGIIQIRPNITTDVQSVVGAVGAYGAYNISGGTFRDSTGTAGGSRFTVSNVGTAAATNGSITGVRVGIVNVSGTGFIDHTNAEWWLNYSLGQINVTDSGKIDHTGSTSPFGIIMNTTVVGGSYGVLNLAGTGAQVITGAQSLRFGNSATAGNGDGLSGFVNLAAGTLSTGAIGTIVLPPAPTATNFIHYNYAGGTLKATGTLASGWTPTSGASATVINTLYGAIDNSAVVGAPSFTGGLTVDTNGNAVTVPNAQPLLAASGVGVTQPNLSVSGGSGYIGAPSVTFSRPAAASGVAASGYALISGGAVTGIVITNPGVYASGETPTIILLGGFASGAGTAATVSSSPLTTANTSGGLTKTGVGTLTLSGSGNTYSGPTLVSAGGLQLEGSAATTPTTGSLTVNAGGTLGFTSGIASTLDLTGKPLALGGGILAFDIGASGVNDALTVKDFTLTANSIVSFNSIGAVASGASYTLLTSANPITTGGFTLTGQTIGKLSLTPTINANTVTITPTLNEGIWNQTGGGDWSNGDPGATAGNWTNYKPTIAGDAVLFGSAISGPATINVDTAHSVGYLRFDNSNAYTLGSGASSNLTIDNGANLASVAVTSGSHVIAENVTLASNLLAAPATGTTLTVSGNLSGTDKALQMVDAGTLVLSGTSNSYTGATSVNMGTLSLTGSLNGGGAIAVSGNGVLSQSSTGIISGATDLTHSSSGTSTLAGVNTYTGNTTVNGGILNITGTVTGNSTSSTLAYGNAAAKTVVNISNDVSLYAVTGANTAGSTAVYNQTAGTVTTTNPVQFGGFVANGGGYGYFNLTGGTFQNTQGSFNITNNNSTASTGVAYVAGNLNLSASTGNMVVAYSGSTNGSLTVAPGGILNYGGSANTFFLTVSLNSYGVLNVAGGNADLGTRLFRVGNAGAGQTGIINLDGGTFTLGQNASTLATTSNLYVNCAGGTLKAAANLSSPFSPGGGLASVSTIFGPINNSAAVGNTSQNFAGGFTVDSNGNSVILGSPLFGATGNGVKQTNITVTSGSGYTGAPMVTFTGGTLATNGTPASGYAVISGGAVTGVVITSPGAYTVDPTVNLTGGGGTGAGVSLSALSANATDAGLTKINTGTLTLGGGNTYVGPTLVSGGTLQLNGSAAITPTTSSITVDPTGTLGFTSGTASTLDLTGKSVTLGGGALAFDIGAGINDSVTVNDFALTGNSFVAATPIGAFTSGGSYTVLTSANPISTSGFSLSGQTAGRLSVTPTVNANTVTLTPTLDEGGWNVDGGGNWDTGSNWANYKPTLAGDAALFGSVITSAANVVVDAAQTVGYLRFNNANSYTIGTNGSSNLTLDNGAAAALVVVNSGSHVIAENVGLNSNLMVAPLTGTTLTVSGNVSGTGKTLDLVEAGTLVLSGTNNSYTGATTVSAATLSLTGSLAGGGALTVSGIGVLNESSTGIISGATALTHSSSGTSSLAGANTSTGNITVTSGQLNISNWSTSSLGTILVSTGGILEFSGSATYGIATRMSVGATSATTGTVNQTGGTVSFTASDCLLVGTGAGTGASGIYNLSGGTLNTTLTSGSRGVMLGVNDGTSATFNLSGAGNLSLPNSILMIGRSDTAIFGCTALFTQTGAASTATVNALSIGGTGAGTANGTMTLTAGTFVANTFTKLATATNDVAVINIGGNADVTLPAFPATRGTDATASINFDGGILRPKAASAIYMGGLTKASIKTGGATFNTGFDITVTQDLLTDVVSTGGSLTKAGVNTLTLTGTNTYTGGSTITGGILSVTNANALGSGDVTFDGGARLLVATGLDVANDITIGANTGASGNGLIQAGATAGTATVSGAITIHNNSTAGGHLAAPTAGTILHVTGAITTTVGVTNGLTQRLGTVMYSGGGTGYTALSSGGTIKVGAENGIASSAIVTLGASGAAGVLDLNGLNQSLVGLVKSASAATIGNSSTITDSTLTTTGTSTFAGVIQDVVSPGTQKVNLAVASGALTLTGANTFSGNIAVNGGTLSATKLGASLNTRTITVENGATLAFGTGNVFGNHATTSVPNIIVNGGTITNGELIITDPLLIKVNNALGNVTLNNGTLTATQGNGNSGDIRPGEGYGAWGLNGTITSTGTSLIDTSAVTGKAGHVLLSSNTADTVFDVASGTLTVASVLQTGESAVNYGLTKTGTGTLSLTAANIYTGNTTVNDGTLELAATGQLKFVLGATSGVNNSLAGTAATLKGSFVIDTTAADALSSGTWTLENITSLTGPAGYDASFSVSGFLDAGSNKWTKTMGAKTYSFDETTGILTLSEGGYASWAATNAPTGTSGDDFDGDGVTNGAEYVLGGTAATNDLGKLPTLTTSGGDLVFTFKRVQASIDGSTTVEIEVGTDLLNWPVPSKYAVPDTATGPVNPGVTVVKDAPADFDTITLTVPRAPDATKFARLKVTVVAAP